MLLTVACSFVSSVSRAGSSPRCKLGSVGGYTASMVALDHNRLGLAGNRADFTRYLINKIHRSLHILSIVTVICSFLHIAPVMLVVTRHKMEK